MAGEVAMEGRPCSKMERTTKDPCSPSKAKLAVFTSLNYPMMGLETDMSLCGYSDV